MALHGDVLGVILSFLSSRAIMHGQLYLVSKDWLHALTELPHAWGLSLDLSWTALSPPFKFAWWKIQSLKLCRSDALSHVPSLTSLKHLDLY